MKRRLIRQGTNTLTITLPSEWVKRLNLAAGSEVDIYEREDSLILHGAEKTHTKTAEISLDGLTVPMFWRFFQGAYRAGCEDIKIVFDKKKELYEDPYHYYSSQFDYADLGEKVEKKPVLVSIQALVDRFIGMEIVDTGEGFVIVKEMGELTSKEFDNSLRRIFIVVFELFDRVIRAIENNEISKTTICKELHTIDLNIDRFVDYCCRILNKIHIRFSEKQRNLLFATLFLMELLGDEFKYIGKHFAVSKKNIKDCLPLTENVRKHFQIYHDLFFNFTREKVIEFGKNDRHIYEEHHNLIAKTGESRSIARHLMLISKLSLSLTELRIEMEF